jgi:hypothetical protein
MKKLLIVLSTSIALASCKLFPSENKRISDSFNTSYHLRLNPENGSEYHYEISNVTDINVEMQGHPIKNTNNTTVGIDYAITKDSTAGFLFKMNYDKAHIRAKNGDNETDMDAANAKYSMNPAEKMLGALKDASLLVSVSSTGVVKIIGGYKELSQQLMFGLNQNDSAARVIAQRQLDKIIGEGMIQKNLDQLFKIFPDSTIRIGDKWKINSIEKGDFNLDVTTSFQLKDISNSIAIVHAQSDLVSENLPVTMMGYTMTPNLKGTQKGKYEIDTKTGMILNSEIGSEVAGNLNLDGSEIPIKIKMTIKMEGQKLR